MKIAIGAIIILIISYILKNAFYKSLCETGKFGCIIGWIAFKSPAVIIIIITIISIILVNKFYSNIF